MDKINIVFAFYNRCAKFVDILGKYQNYRKKLLTDISKNNIFVGYVSWDTQEIFL